MVHRLSGLVDRHGARVCLPLAQLAFAQAGKNADEAEVELREILEPNDGQADKLRAMLDRLLERDVKRRRARASERVVACRFKFDTI